jgi:serine/threonine protein kinase
MGALGPVFRAQGTAGGELIAIKAFKLDVSPELAPSIADGLRELVRRAARVEGLMPLVDASIEGETPWLAMEYLAHPTLDTHLRDSGPLPLDQVTALVRGLADAIDTAHAHGLCHGSLHPRDIFLGPDGEVVVSGFGVAAALGVAGLRPPRRRPFTAPETLAQRALDVPADRYALGVIAYEIVSGRRLLGAGDDLAAGLAARAATSDIDRAATAFAAMLAERPEHRPSTSLVFAQALCAALESPGPAATAVTLVVPPLAEPLAPTIVTGGARAARSDDDAPPADALAEFARQGTFWEPPRREDDDVATAFLAGREHAYADPGLESPTEVSGEGESAAEPELRRPPEAAATGILGLGPGSRPESHPELRAGLRPELRPGSLPELESELESELEPELEPEPVTDSLRMRDRAVALPPPETGPQTPPLVVLALTLGLGLAVGAAGGYLVGQRSGERAAQRALGGETNPPEAFGTETPASAPVSAAPAGAGGEAAADAPPAAAPSPAAPTASSPAPPTRPAENAADAAARARPTAPRTAQLVIRSTPVRAGVIIDGTWRGRTPLTVAGLSFGTHSVRVVADDHVAETRRVGLDARNVSTTVSFQLAPLRAAARPAPAPARPGVTTGRLLVESRPSGASVYIDGRLVGTTRLQIADLAAGAHQVRLELPGHLPLTTSATVVAGQQIRVAASLEESPDR